MIKFIDIHINENTPKGNHFLFDKIMKYLEQTENLISNEVINESKTEK